MACGVERLFLSLSLPVPTPALGVWAPCIEGAGEAERSLAPWQRLPAGGSLGHQDEKGSGDFLPSASLVALWPAWEGTRAPVAWWPGA